MNPRSRRPPAVATFDLDGKLPIAQVSSKAAAGWRAFADGQTCSYSAMVEAIGRWLYENRDVPIDEMDPNIRDTLKLAQDIFHERRSRKAG